MRSFRATACLSLLMAFIGFIECSMNPAKPSISPAKPVTLARSHSSSSLRPIEWVAAHEPLPQPVDWATHDTREVVVATTPYGLKPRPAERIMSAGEAALLVSKKYVEIGGNQHRKLEHIDRLKERMLARLQGQILVETTFRYHQNDGNEIPQGEVALVGSWAQWVMLHGMDQVSEKVWELSLNLPPGTHEFKFLINGQWRLSSSYQKVDDGVGTDGNNSIEVPEPDKDAGGLVLQQLEQWLKTVGLSGEVLDRFVEVWLWKNCPC